MIGLAVLTFLYGCFGTYILIKKIIYYTKHGEWYIDSTGGNFLPGLLVTIMTWGIFIFSVVQLCQQ